MRKFDEVRGMLSDKISKEKKRLKSFGTKANSFDLAHAITRFVIALMTESRNRELKRTLKIVSKSKVYKERGARELLKHLQERLHATKLMAEAITNTAEEDEANRPWKPKHLRKKKKHGHSKTKNKNKRRDV